MRVVAVQGAAYGDPASFDLERNRAAYLEQIEEACREQRPSLVVLPELFVAPYFCGSHDPRYFELAETLDGPTVTALAEVARDHGAYVTAPVFERGVAGEHYDSCALVGPDGVLCEATVVGTGESQPCARKVHIPDVHALGASLDEKFWFRPGAGLTTFDTDLGRIGCLVCYDRSFPEAWRTLVLAGAEVIVIPVASHGFREALFLAELQTLAAGNGVFAVAANRAGPERVESRVEMFGNSCIVSPLGELLAHAPSRDAHVVAADLDPDAVTAARRQMPYLRDRRPECYSL